jgi:hypothetical protein
MGAVKMKRNLPSQHTKSGKKTKQPENMIAVKMGDQYMMDSGGIDPKLPEPDLGTFPTIN